MRFDLRPIVLTSEKLLLYLYFLTAALVPGTRMGSKAKLLTSFEVLLVSAITGGNDCFNSLVKGVYGDISGNPFGVCSRKRVD